jgi:hypothetical protein
MRQLCRIVARFGPTTAKPPTCIRDVAQCGTVEGVILEPAHVPLPQVIGPHDPEGAIAPVQDRQIALQLAVFAQHRRKAGAAGLRQPAGEGAVQPGGGLRAADLIAREGGDIEQPGAFPRGAAFRPDQVEGVRPFQRGVLDKSSGAK